METTAKGGWTPSRGSARRTLILSAVALAAITFVSALVLPALAAEPDWAVPAAAIPADRPLAEVRPVPAFSTEPGPWEVSWAASGMMETSGAATLELDLPGPPLKAVLYLSGRDDPLGPAPHFPRGDANVRVEVSQPGSPAHAVGVVPVVYRSGMHSVNRLDVTRFLEAGANTVRITGYDLNLAEGAFVYAVSRGNVPDRFVQVADGLDIGFYPFPPPYGPDSELASFRFLPLGCERTGSVVLAIAGAEAGRGDEVFGITGVGAPAGYLPDSDGDRRPDIVNRRARLELLDRPPLRVDRANPGGALEALRRAQSLEEDCLGAGCSSGAQFNVVSRPYAIASNRSSSAFQVQSEDPEYGDSFTLLVAINEVPAYCDNPVPPEIDVVKDVTPTEMPETEGPATFTVTVSNPGPDPLLLDVTLVDDVFGDLNGRGTCVLPVSLALGASYSCTFDAVVHGTVEVPHRNTVTAAGYGSLSGDRVTDDDPAVVTFTRATASLGDRVWLDANRNGLQDGEAGIDGVTVVLKDGVGNILATTTTATVGGVDGYYLFANLPAGAYAVEVLPPAGLVQTYDLDGLGTPNAAARALAPGEAATDVDFGYWRPVPGLTVEKSAAPLEVYPGDAITYTYVVTNTGNATLVDVVVTDDRIVGPVGTASRLDPGASATFVVVVTAPACGQGGTTTTPCVQAAPAAFAAVVAPLFHPPDPCYLRNVATVTAYEEVFRTLVTDTDDACITILPFGMIGDRAWDDLNGDGIRQIAEPGLPGVTVTLRQGASVLATTVTNAAGWYGFTGLRDGEYTVDPVTPAGYVLTSGNDPLTVTLGPGQGYLTARFGYRLAP